MLETAKIFITIYCLKDEHHKNHAARVEKIAVGIGAMIGLSGDELQRLHYAALLHDIGKALLPESLLNKKETLTQQEWSQLREHPRYGYEVLKFFAPMVAEGILHHHENWNGTGYPGGLKGDEIPLFSRIIRIADSIDAGSSERSYKAKKEMDQVLQEIRQGAGEEYDPTIAHAVLCKNNSMLAQTVQRVAV